MNKMNFLEFFTKISVYNPFRKNYSKMVHEICVDVEKERFIKTMFTLSQEERDNLLLEMQSEILSTKFD